MQVDQLAKLLGDNYRTAAKGEKVLSLYLFGIKFCRELDGHALGDLCEQAGLARSYGTESAKARRLAPHVILRDHQ